MTGDRKRRKKGVSNSKDGRWKDNWNEEEREGRMAVNEVPQNKWRN